MRNEEITFSFIIPALNEETNIQNAIQSIRTALDTYPHDVIVADNGSNDATVYNAELLGAKTLTLTNASIAGLRNAGAKIAEGNFLVFIDADVTIHKHWLAQTIAAVTPPFLETNFITGSTCLVPENPSFIQKHWFSKLPSASSDYINSGHLLIPKKTFDALGGFDGNLTTSEDYDLCHRALLRGIEVFKSPDIVAYHHGYPSSLKDFVIREAWHGRQDFKNLRSAVSSKTACLAITNITMLLLTVILLIATGVSIYVLAGITAMAGLSVLFVLVKFKNMNFTPRDLFLTACCANFYLIGRAFSPIFTKRRPEARTRSGSN